LDVERSREGLTTLDENPQQPLECDTDRTTKAA